MLKGIQITAAKNKSLINSIWLMDYDTHDIQCLQGFNGRVQYRNFNELGLVDFKEVDVPQEVI